MRIGLLADAHGNAEGLGLCLRVLRQCSVDRLVFLGDALGYFPYGAAVAHMLWRAGALCLMGNHEAMTLGRLPVPPAKAEVLRLARSSRHVPARWWRQVERTGPRARVRWDGTDMEFVHATPQDPLTGRHDPTEGLAASEAAVVVAGHTHRPAHMSALGKMWINPGSCGYPRDHGSLLSCAVLDTQARTARVWRTPFVFRPALLSACHVDVLACTRRTCAHPLGQWRGQHA